LNTHSFPLLSAKAHYRTAECLIIQREKKQDAKSAGQPSSRLLIEEERFYLAIVPEQ
jgi:hypothetical protein